MILASGLHNTPELKNNFQKRIPSKFLIHSFKRIQKYAIEYQDYYRNAG
jgi:hypothetical protein